jgi:RimJ/RimL family protein N-acetyltransferase
MSLEKDKNTVRLRALTLDDARITWKWRNQEEVRNDFSGHPFPVSLDEELQWYEKNIKVNFPNTCFGVEEIKGSHLVGMTFLKNIHMIFRHAEFSILIDGAQKGKGYGKEACYKTLLFGFRQLGLNKIYLKVRTDNTSAIRIYESCGFKVEGTIREDIYKQGKYIDQFCMGILIGEFEKL